MILTIATLLISLASAEPKKCCEGKGVADQVNALESQIKYSNVCITHDPKKKIEDEVAKLTEDEVMARLVLAETMATKCTPTKEIMSGIATVISNRVKRGGIYGKGVREVVFKPSQFNSSLSTAYSRSQYKRFLCPVMNTQSQTEKDLWEDAKIASRTARNPQSRNFLGSDLVTMTYYYKHFLPKIVNPPVWASPHSSKRVRLNNANAPEDCIGFFRN